MYKLAIVVAAFSLPLQQAWAVDADAVVGGAIGGGLGAAVGSEIGGRDGAIAGSAIGAAVGTAVATGGKHDKGGGDLDLSVHHKKHKGGPPAHAYHAPPGKVKHHKKKNKH